MRLIDPTRTPTVAAFSSTFTHLGSECLSYLLNSSRFPASHLSSSDHFPLLLSPSFFHSLASSTGCPHADSCSSSLGYQRSFITTPSAQQARLPDLWARNSSVDLSLFFSPTLLHYACGVIYECDISHPLSYMI